MSDHDWKAHLVEDFPLALTGVRLARDRHDGRWEWATAVDSNGHVLTEIRDSVRVAPDRPLLWLPPGADRALAEALRVYLPTPGEAARVEELRSTLERAEARVDRVLDRYLGAT